MSDALFDPPPGTVVPADPKLSADRRRTLRQRQAVANGVHPLSLALPRAGIRVHEGARLTGWPTCGTCWYRRRISTGSARDWPKCLFGQENYTDQQRGRLPRVTRGSGTDVRRWWPACADWTPGDPALSPDAARYVPDAAPVTDPSTGVTDPAGPVSSPAGEVDR